MTRGIARLLLAVGLLGCEESTARGPKVPQSPTELREVVVGGLSRNGASDAVETLRKERIEAYSTRDEGPPQAGGEDSYVVLVQRGDVERAYLVLTKTNRAVSMPHRRSTLGPQRMRGAPP